jgi:5-methylcytosine-specific restriction endonuclease McrA
MIYSPLILSMYAKLSHLAFPTHWSNYHKKYASSEKGKATRKRHSKSLAFKATQRRYGQSPTGKLKKLLISRRHQTLKRKARQGCQREVEKIYARAQELRQWFNVVVDHIVPLAKGGAHTTSNLQIIYSFENAAKADSLTYKPKVIFQ